MIFDGNRGSSMAKPSGHVPVLLNEVINFLDVENKQKFIDGTAGDGGHLLAIAEKSPTAKILGIDLDQASLDHLQTEVVRMGLGQRIQLVQGSYKNIDTIAAGANFSPADGILVDLGFSSFQLDDPNRGFSFQTDGPLDMRYDKTSRLNAEQVVSTYHQAELEQVISDYGEEKFARRIATAIVAKRQTSSIKTTSELAEIIRQALPVSVRFKANDSIRRVFQAIRIEVNHELDNLKEFLPKAVKLLGQNGRLVIISFHSLEDRIVKEFFNQEAKDCVCPPEFPTCVCDKVSTARILTRKPVTAGEEEMSINPRSKSAKLRAMQKI